MVRSQNDGGGGDQHAGCSPQGYWYAIVAPKNQRLEVYIYNPGNSGSLANRYLDNDSCPGLFQPLGIDANNTDADPYSLGRYSGFNGANRPNFGLRGDYLAPAAQASGGPLYPGLIQSLGALANLDSYYTPRNDPQDQNGYQRQVPQDTSNTFSIDGHLYFAPWTTHFRLFKAGADPANAQQRVQLAGNNVGGNSTSVNIDAPTDPIPLSITQGTSAQNCGGAVSPRGAGSAQTPVPSNPPSVPSNAYNFQAPDSKGVCTTSPCTNDCLRLGLAR